MNQSVVLTSRTPPAPPPPRSSSPVALLAAHAQPEGQKTLVVGPRPALARYGWELACLGPEDYGRSMRETYAAERRAVEQMGLAATGS